ncbi:MAG TPA: sugar ABC transporter substrate-binding protein, partial [Candidatus Eisenbergiella merdipullorum]|nr:sugar ABC transporter substrate-binding protein [Candidatus Eisenbergiella merdipullorum]
DCQFYTAIGSESDYRDTLSSLYTQYRDELTMCDPDEFDSLYDQRAQEYMDAGYKAITDERLAAYEAGQTTKLPE